MISNFVIIKKRFMVVCLFFLFLAQNAMSQNINAIPEVIQQFVAAVNSHNVEKISLLLTEHHSFTDASDQKITGKLSVVEAWKQYFSLFQDYTIEINECFGNNNSFLLTGYASGYHDNPLVDRKPAPWRIPASFRVDVSDNLISSWKVYSDTKIPFESIASTSAAIKSTPPENEGIQMFGGVFFKAKDPKSLAKWYDTNLNTHFGENQYSSLMWRDSDNPEKEGRTEFCIFSLKSKYFGSSKKPFMFNFRVKNLDSLLSRLKANGVKVEEKTESYEFGKFGWIYDAEGNKIELWQPFDSGLKD